MYVYIQVCNYFDMFTSMLKYIVNCMFANYIKNVLSKHMPILSRLS